MNRLRDVAAAVVSTARLLWRVDRRLALLCWLMAVVLGLLPVAMSVATATVVGASPDVVSDGLDSAAGHRLTLAVVLFAVVFVVSSVIGPFVQPLRERLSRRADALVRERVMRASLGPVGVRHMEDAAMQRAFETARNISPLGMTPGFGASFVPMIVAERIRLVTYVVILAVLSPLAGLALAGLLVLNQKEMHKAMMRTTGANFASEPPVFAHYHRDLASTAAPAKEVRVFGLGTWLEDRYETSLMGNLRNMWFERRVFTPSLWITVVVNAIVTAVVIASFGLAAARGDLGLGALTFVIGAVLALSPRAIFWDMNVMYGAAGLSRLEEAEALAALEPGGGGTLSAAGMPVAAIEFENVSFRYPDSTVDVLRDLSVVIHAGERTALVGVNGVGKTTLVKLLCKLYEPTSGRILVDGVDLRELDTVAWRRQLAVLFQDYLQYELSVLDNVRYGAVEVESPLEPARSAAASAGAAEIIDGLPSGWDTVLSASYSGGTDLSGGQWQRIALSRAMLAVGAGARVLVLDEPTANLDIRAEAELYGQLTDFTRGADRDGGARGLTTLLISHRFSTVRQADRIVVLSGGQVAEDGTHDNLMRAAGMYARMFDAQAARFAETVDEEPT
jgi:ATP-binding cassette, subfamily B, bacterial